MAKLISSKKIPADLIPKLNKVRKRILFLSPSVTSGCEREPCRDDFEFPKNANIGSGGFAQVYKVRHKVSRNVYALKIVSKQKIFEEDLCEQIALEIRIMYSLDHEHIVKLCNHFEDNEYCYLVLEYVPCGNLYNKLKHVGRFLETDAAQYLREVISAVEYLHSLNPPIIHRDIKPENILLSAKESAKVCDFGWSNFFNSKLVRKTYCGTPIYLSPEMIKQKGHDQRLDIWNLGVLLFEMLTGEPPFSGKDQVELFNNILNVKINYPKDFPQLAKDLVSKLLKPRPKDRLSLQEILMHPWIKSRPTIRPVLTREIKMEMKLPALDQDLEEKEYEPVSKVSKLNREAESKAKAAVHVENHFSAKARAERDEFISEVCDQLKIKTKELNDQKGKFEALLNEFKSVKQENEDLKAHLGVSERGYMSTEKLEIRKLMEELNKLKAVNKDREEVIANLTKTKEALRDAIARNRMLANEMEVLREEKKSLEAKINEQQAKLENAERSYAKLKQESEQRTYTNERMKVEFEAQINALQHNLPSVANNTGFVDASSLEVMKNCSAILSSIKQKIKKEMSYKKSAESTMAKLANEKAKLDELRSKYEAKVSECEQVIAKSVEEVRQALKAEARAELKERDSAIEQLASQLKQNEVQREKRISEGDLIRTLQVQNQQLIKLTSDLKTQVGLYGKEQKYLRQLINAKNTRIQDLEFQLEQQEERFERNNSA
eukprot:TRINITY_DN1924_c0_g1_i7.p1 TRINITY_DN1924_c0_g1~~TRINITY_DN1924_c0_g1_i7.p1  ORF type:complete len:720 (+),score=256.08 TRINITY_DN1924_c0_g1_i7:160-2319(+)